MAGRGNLQRAACLRLAAHIGKIRPGGGKQGSKRLGLRCAEFTFTPQMGGKLGDGRHTVNGNIFYHGGLGGIVGRDKQRFDAICPRSQRHARLAVNSEGREREEEPCPLRTCFQRDVDRITHSKSFRRLKHKTQVFLQPEGDHYRTRLTHTLEVSRLARTIARALELNEDLAEAMVETINKVIRVSRQLLQELGHDPTAEEIAAEMNMPVDKVRDILKIAQEPVSLETPIGEEEDSHLGDFIPDEDASEPSEAASFSLLKEQLMSSSRWPQPSPIRRRERRQEQGPTEMAVAFSMRVDSSS